MKKRPILNITRRFFLAIVFFYVAIASLPVHPQSSSEQSWSFAVMGDSQNKRAFPTLLQLILNDSSRPEMVFLLGDMVRTGNDSAEWAKYREVISILGNRIKLYPVVGNHDVSGTKDMGTYIKEAQPPGGKSYYSLIYKGAGFICLNSYEPEMAERIGPEQMQWLKQTLKEMKAKAHPIFAFLHTPLLVRQDYKHNAPLADSDKVRAVFRVGGVTAVFVGHEHRYDHFEEKGIHYFVTGGAGAALYTQGEDGFHHYCRVTVEPKKMLVEAIDMNGEKKKEVSISLGSNQ